MITYSQLQDLHEQIKTGKPVFSTRVQLNALDTIAMICSTGQLGYIELVEEYGSPLTIETINKYIGGDLGINELQTSSVSLFNQFDEMCHLVFESAKAIISLLKV